MRPRPKASRQHARRFLYGACIEESYPGLRELSGISDVGDVGYVETEPNADGSVILNCGEGRQILLGASAASQAAHFCKRRASPEQVRPVCAQPSRKMHTVSRMVQVDVSERRSRR